MTFSKYPDFLDVSKKEVKIELLSETNNMYRTIISLIVMLSILYGFHTLENYHPIVIQLRWILLAFFLRSVPRNLDKPLSGNSAIYKAN